MTIASINNAVSKHVRNRAAKEAKKTGENMVVCRAKIANDYREIFVSASKYAAAPENPDVEFIATLDENGDYVD